MAVRSSAVYRWAGAALLRASTDPGGLDLPEDLDLFGDDTAQRGLAWLSAVWQREEVRAALGEASPALSRQIDAMVALGSRDASRVRRAVISLASDVLRWQQRPTPFGLFAGVGLARIGARAEVRWGREHRVTVRADAAWLGDVLARLHQCPELLERLSVVVNDAGSVRGDRFVAPGPAPDGVPQALAPIEVSVRHSRPVRTALEAACEPVKFGELRKLLIHQFPAAAAQQIDGLLAGLLGQRMLISSLWAPMTCPDALGHACAELEAADAHNIPEVMGMVRALSAIHKELSTDSPAVAPRSAVTERMRALSEAADVPLVIDTILDCDVQIPEQVAREACDAVRVLYRLSPYPLGYPAWRDYHTRFLDRYGPGDAGRRSYGRSRISLSLRRSGPQWRGRVVAAR